MTAVPTTGRRGHRTLRRISAVGFGASVFAFATSLILDSGPPREYEARFSEGLAHAEARRVSEATEAFREVTQSGDSVFAAMAYHNLGVLTLDEASGAVGSHRRALAETAVQLATTSLLLQPGRRSTSQTLELALRWSTDPPSSASTDLSTPSRDRSEADDTDSKNREQSGGDDADTKGGIGSPWSKSQGPGAGTQELGREAALRLLASFRLLELDGTRSLIQSMLRSSTSRNVSGRSRTQW